MRAVSRVRHEEVKAVEVVSGGGIAGGDVVIVEEHREGRLMGFNRYRLAARVSKLVVEGDWEYYRDERRVLFEPRGGHYPTVEIEFCPSCEETVLRVRVVGGGSGAPG